MICASCDREISDSGVICPTCNILESPTSSKSEAEPGYRDLSKTLRHLKGLVLLSVMFGIFVAPFAIYLATKALRTYGPKATDDPVLRRKLAMLRKTAVALLLVWAALLGSWVALLVGT